MPWQAMGGADDASTVLTAFMVFSPGDCATARAPTRRAGRARVPAAPAARGKARAARACGRPTADDGATLPPPFRDHGVVRAGPRLPAGCRHATRSWGLWRDRRR